VFNWRVVDCDLAIGLCTLLPKAEVFKILWKVIDNTWQNYDKILWPLLSLCSTFGLDRDRVINQYITTLLLLQEDDDSSTGIPGSGPDEGQPLCNEEALERVLEIIPMLNSPSELTSSLCAALFKVSHLKSYKRVSPPSDVENTYLLENGLLPNPLSNSRLPFHLLMQTKHFWKIICELTSSASICIILFDPPVSLDKLYMSAANHVFEKKMKPLILEQRKKGQGHGYNKETVKVAKTMMKYIQCIQSLEWAAATAHRITQELPPGLSCILAATLYCTVWLYMHLIGTRFSKGLEKTQSLRFCLGLGEVWLKDPNLEEAARARGETFLSKLKLQFQRSATENMLMSSQLSSPEHLKLTGLPARLIMALYEHSSVEQRYRETLGQSFPVCSDGELEHLSSVSCLFGSCRVVYMLQSYPVDYAMRLLNPILSAETWPLSSSGPRLTFCHRTRVLFCLIRLADAATLEAQLQIPRSKFEYYLKSYIFVSQLEALNIPYTVQSFLSSPKEGLVKGLWKNHSHEPQVRAGREQQIHQVISFFMLEK
ncbi:hypothetical protein GOODEAATRI_015724, partial [Goodea atripinnis]